MYAHFKCIPRFAIALTLVLSLGLFLCTTPPSAKASDAAFLNTGESELGNSVTLGWNLPEAYSALPSVRSRSLAASRAFWLENSELTHGFQTLIHIDSPSAPTHYRFSLHLPEGTEIVPYNEGGSVAYGLFNHGDLLATVAQPWAFDASGTPVETELRIENDSLVQIVHHGPSNSYPITADPQVDWGWGSTTIRLSYNETRATGAVTGAGGLAALPWLAAAGVATGPIGIALIAAWGRLSFDALGATHRNQCLGITVTPNPFTSNFGVSTFEYGCR